MQNEVEPQNPITPKHPFSTELNDSEFQEGSPGFIRRFKPAKHPYRIKIQLSYDGSEFNGWQRQSDGGKPTVQGTLESALSRLYKNEKINVMGSGRTDTGVHALSQFAHADVPWILTVPDMAHTLNAILPHSIVVENVWLAPEGYHAGLSAIQKTYRYVIHNSPRPHAIKRKHSTWIRHDLDLERLNSYCKYLIGQHDFKSFQNAGTEVSTTVREIFNAHWFRIDPATVAFEVTGSGFLKQMVRNIVGTQFTLHNGARPPEDMLTIMKALDRRAAGKTAPPQGLYLLEVRYPDVLDKKCRKL
ncbi:MAG: tRNA pseudouridine(38-40) synthase TruA [Bdellovibrionales bacterium]|nr:tRNA pseudouridine(38-40) synthase TruA [Bdellovibrionales bacterium]